MAYWEKTPLEIIFKDNTHIWRELKIFPNEIILVNFFWNEFSSRRFIIIRAIQYQGMFTGKTSRSVEGILRNFGAELSDLGTV